MIYKCPYADCDGQLEYITHESTTMGFFAFDNNRVRETFVCNKCGKKVSRYFKWFQEELDEGEKTC